MPLFSYAITLADYYAADAIIATYWLFRHWYDTDTLMPLIFRLFAFDIYAAAYVVFDYFHVFDTHFHAAIRFYDAFFSMPSFFFCHFFAFISFRRFRRCRYWWCHLFAAFIIFHWLFSLFRQFSPSWLLRPLFIRLFSLIFSHCRHFWHYASMPPPFIDIATPPFFSDFHYFAIDYYFIIFDAIIFIRWLRLFPSLPPLFSLITLIPLMFFSHIFIIIATCCRSLLLPCSFSLFFCLI